MPTQELEHTPCLILTGGLGTRLRPAVADVPKTMAPVAGKPFLEYLITWISRAGFRPTVLCVGYRSRQIQEHFGDGEKFGVRLIYSIETEPLGTWGAIRQAKQWTGPSEFLVVNGDSWVDVDLRQLLEFHRTKRALASLALVQVENPARYGSVKLDSDRKILDFTEKSTGGATLINAGVYVFSQEIFSAVPAKVRSLEKEVFPVLVGKQMYGLPVQGLFIDVGLPEEYKYLCRNSSLWFRALGICDEDEARC